MLKKLILGTALLISVSAFAQNKPAAEEAKTTPRQAEDLLLASQLVNYGYETKTALPLIQAVQIYQRLNAQAQNLGEKSTKREADVSGNITKEGRPSFSEEQLLADATVFADGDKTLLALIKDCKGATRGPVDGVIIHSDCVDARSIDYYYIRFKGGEIAYVAVGGDGDTDLDLYILDENGNLIVSDTRFGDRCECSFIPLWTGTFTVAVRNHGSVYNCYILGCN